MLGIIGIVLSLVGLMYFAYRGINVLVLAPLMALLAILVSGGEPLLATYTQIFMQSLGSTSSSSSPSSCSARCSGR